MSVRTTTLGRAASGSIYFDVGGAASQIAARTSASGAATAKDRRLGTADSVAERRANAHLETRPPGRPPRRAAFPELSDNRGTMPSGPLILSGLVVGLSLVVAGGARAQTDPRPNLVLILADDLGYGDLGSYGQRTVQTPRLDRLAAEGIRFSQFYAGSTVCAPSRSVLMTGQHMGHTRVRGNAGAGNYAAQTLAASDVTIARLLRQAGYATGLVGKWGLGEIGSEGEPLRHGFDEFFGFVNQTHAHNHYPDFLWRGSTKVPLPNDLVPMGGVPGAGYATRRVAYAGDLFFDEAVAFIERHKGHPFFLELALTVPHANNERARALGDGQEVPDYGPYASKDWPEPMKGQAAMITRMDRRIGESAGSVEGPRPRRAHRRGLHE